MHTKKKLLKLIAASIIAGGFTFTPNLYLFTDLPLTMSIAHAEIKTYTGVGESIISDRETLDIGKQGAKLQAIRNAQDQAGIFISSRSEVVNGKLEKDEIVAFTAGIVKISDNVKYEPIPLGDALGTIKYRAIVVVTIDTDELEARINQWLNKNAQDRSVITAQNNELNKTVDEIKKTNERIESQIASAKTSEDTTKIKAELKELDRDTLYAQKIAEGRNLFRTDPNRALTLYKEAIQINPDATSAYEFLGRLYNYQLRDYDKAIECYNKVIQMEPNRATPSYLNELASIYRWINNEGKTIENYQKALDALLNYDSRGQDIRDQFYRIVNYCREAIDKHRAANDKEGEERIYDYLAKSGNKYEGNYNYIDNYIDPLLQMYIISIYGYVKMNNIQKVEEICSHLGILADNYAAESKTKSDWHSQSTLMIAAFQFYEKSFDGYAKIGNNSKAKEIYKKALINIPKEHYGGFIETFKKKLKSLGKK